MRNWMLSFLDNEMVLFGDSVVNGVGDGIILLKFIGNFI